MMTKAELRKTRLAAAYKDMQSFTGQRYIEWKAIKGTAPYIEEYLLTIKVRTYYDKDKTMDQCQVQISFPASFPSQAPSVQIVSSRLVYHPHWFRDGKYCPGSWSPVESFEVFIKRMIMTLQNEPTLINPDSPANSDAMRWYLANKTNKRLFPSDHQELSIKKRFVIK